MYNSAYGMMLNKHPGYPFSEFIGITLPGMVRTIKYVAPVQQGNKRLTNLINQYEFINI